MASTMISGADSSLIANDDAQNYGTLVGETTRAVEGMTTHTEDEPPERGATFGKNLGTLEAIAIAISIVIGSGIFTSPRAINTNVPSPSVAIVVWLVGGTLAWTGASTMAELGTAIPGEGKQPPSCTKKNAIWLGPHSSDGIPLRYVILLGDQSLTRSHRWRADLSPLHLR